MNYLISLIYSILKLIDYALDRTDFLIVNSHHLHDELRKKNVTRFAEAFWYFWVER